MLDYQDILRRLAIGDTSLLDDVTSDGVGRAKACGLDPKAAAFACLGASVAIGTSSSGFQSQADEALAAGATVEEVVGLLVAVGPTAGRARVILAAPALGLAVGYDTDAALEQVDPGC